MNRILYALCFSFSLMLSSCFSRVEGEGPALEKRTDLESFQSLEVDLPANVLVVIADSSFCTIKAQENIQNLIALTVSKGKLRLNSKKAFSSKAPIAIVVHTPLLHTISINGSADVRVEGSLKDKKVELTVNGSGDIKTRAEASELRSVINGSGDILLSGTADDHKIIMNGSGNVVCNALQSNSAKIRINGSGNADVNVGTKLDVVLIGSGNVRYTGNPAVKSEITGTGDIARAQ